MPKYELLLDGDIFCGRYDTLDDAVQAREDQRHREGRLKPFPRELYSIQVVGV